MEIWKNLYEAGGLLTVLIIVAGIIAAYISLERLFHFHRARIDTREFLRGIFNNLEHNNILEAIKICDTTPGPVSHMVREAIVRGDKPSNELRENLTDIAMTEIPRLERNLNLLTTLSNLAPLIGFFGTVVGMISAFAELKMNGSTTSVNSLSSHIEFALYTTAAGLAVAIPGHTIYNILVQKVQNLVVDMEKVTNEMIYFFETTDIDISAVRAKIHKK